MNYLKAFLFQNGKQLLVVVLSAVDGALILAYPAQREWFLLGATVLAGFGLHLDPLIYSRSALQARAIDKALVATAEIEETKP